ncbi:MAG: bifunctional folylpolyglutamate synthase/dihydrofolate synthase [Polyangiales bacterium]
MRPAATPSDASCAGAAYRDALAYLYRLAPRGTRLGLDAMRQALAKWGRPERGLPAVHIAGTNGKGSVATLVAAGLQQAGLRVGLYTSPHLHSFRERIRINGRMVGQDELTCAVRRLQRQAEAGLVPSLSFFESATLLALHLFRAHRCDIIVMEVGLGGRLDATNVVDSVVCAITSIALDHEAWLGSSLSAIAGEKAGILRPRVPVVSGVPAGEAAVVIADTAAAKQAPLYVHGRDFDVTVLAAPGAAGPAVCQSQAVRHLALQRPAHAEPDRFRAKTRLHFRGWSAPSLELPCRLHGAHQHTNHAVGAAVLCALSAQGMHIDAGAIQAGFRQVEWPGRLECLPTSPLTLIDAAHNPAAMATLCTLLESADWPRPRALIFAAMHDKDWPAMLDMLAPHIDHPIYLALPMARAMPPDVLSAHLPGACVEDPAAALALAAERVGPEGLVVAAGSIYNIALVRAAALALPQDPLVVG